jgi:transposase-like protein
MVGKRVCFTTAACPDPGDSATIAASYGCHNCQSSCDSFLTSTLQHPQSLRMQFTEHCMVTLSGGMTHTIRILASAQATTDAQIRGPDRGVTLSEIQK